MGKRIDNLLIHNGIIYILEFKIFAKTFEMHAVEQVIDYALDLKNFHSGSHDKTLVPILVSTMAPTIQNNISFADDCISNCLKANSNNLSQVINNVDAEYKQDDFDIDCWQNSSYKPTPTIIEAAQTLYTNHSVKDISRRGAEAINLSLTKNAVESIIKVSKKNKQKSICFITGVPGSGKTLAGLYIAIHSMNYDEDEHACYLSGNGPLVKVLRGALINNKAEIEKVSKKSVEREVEAFIQNIHQFRDLYVEDTSKPPEKVVIFDEAQRAWNKEQASKFMNKKNKIKNFDYSEPEFLISVMDRHKDWCVIVCLIGGGQEINTGEAGLVEWFRTLKNKFAEWKVYCSSEVIENNYLTKANGSELIDGMNICQQKNLHLSVSLRTFKSAILSEFIEYLINNEPKKAQEIYTKMFKKYPIYITRDLETAKNWVKNKARGTQRIGLLAHSNAIRLKPEGIFIKSKIESTNWFLNKKEDVRSSCALEDCATEFDVQGLELDWTIVAWDANLRYKNNWKFLKFSGTQWKNIKNEADKKYLLNSYRVLLTRARQGIVIFVPYGDIKDETRKPEFYDGIYKYLQECGIKEL